MFTVVACGFAAASIPGLPAEDVTVMPHPTSDAFVDVALDLALDRSASDQPVLLLHDSAPASEHRTRMLRSATGRRTVLPVGLSVPPTALAAAATVLATLASADLEPGAVLGSLGWIAAGLPVQALTARLSRLEYDGIRLSHRLAALVPRSVTALRFEETVLAGSSAREPLHAVIPSTLVVAGDARLGDTLPTAAGDIAESTRPNGIDAFGTAWWGTRSYAEHCLVPLSLDPWVDRISAARWRRCPQCQGAMGAHCHFCSAQEVLT